MAVSLLKGALILTNFVAFITKLVFNKQANTVSKLFPRRTGEVSDRAQTDLTPSSATFAIWGLIYLLQLAWIAYTVSLIFRPASPDILPNAFYLVYTLSCFFNVTWLMVWARQKFALSAMVLAGITLSLAMCLFLAYTSLDSYLKTSHIEKEPVSDFDVWCLRIFVQNGVMFYTAWVSIASCINFAIYLQENLGVPRPTAGSVAFSVLLCLLVVWFILENFIVSSYLKYTFAEHLVLIIGLTGVLKKQWSDGHGNQAYALAILVLSIVMFAVRLLLMWLTSNSKNDLVDKAM